MIRMTITNPSESGFVDYRRNMMVNGEIETDSPLPDDAVLEVSLFDLAGNRLRFARQTKKNNRNLYLAHPDLIAYREELDPGKEKLIAFGFPELLVEDLAHPEDSLRNATIKAFYSDTHFKALIVSATDATHGLPADDGVSFTDENGAPYEALPMGDYRVRAKLRLSEGQTLASDERMIHIGRQENQLICRFNPPEHKARMKKWAEEQGIAVINDCLPGYLDPYLGTWFYHMGLLPMYRANDLASYVNTKTHFFVYLIEEDSTSYETELSYLQSIGAVGDSSRFQAYAYDIGEAVIRKGTSNEQAAKVVPFREEEYLRVSRIDTVNARAKENTFFLNESAAEEMTPAYGEECVSVRSGSRIGIMSVVRPFQLPPEDFILKRTNVYEIRNRIETLRYTFSDGEQSWAEERKLLLERFVEIEKEKNAGQAGESAGQAAGTGEEDDGPRFKSIGKSVFEAYNLFTIPTECSGKMLDVMIQGIDSYGNETPARGHVKLFIKSAKIL